MVLVLARVAGCWVGWLLAVCSFPMEGCQFGKSGREYPNLPNGSKVEEPPTSYIRLSRIVRHFSTTVSICQLALAGLVGFQLGFLVSFSWLYQFLSCYHYQPILLEEQSG